MEDETTIMSRIRKLAGIQTKEDIDEAFGITINPDKAFGLAEVEVEEAPVSELDDIFDDFDASLDRSDMPDHAIGASPYDYRPAQPQQNADGDYLAATAHTVTFQLGTQHASPAPPPPILYKTEDIDKLIKMLTLWIDDRSVILKMEEMYKQWKDLQKKR